jgi:hypothetical protein
MIFYEKGRVLIFLAEPALRGMIDRFFGVGTNGFFGQTKGKATFVGVLPEAALGAAFGFRAGCRALPVLLWLFYRRILI